MGGVVSTKPPESCKSCEHELAISGRTGNWFCDQCRKTSIKHPEALSIRWRCGEGCNYDLCENCAQSRSERLRQTASASASAAQRTASSDQGASSQSPQSPGAPDSVRIQVAPPQGGAGDGDLPLRTFSLPSQVVPEDGVITQGQSVLTVSALQFSTSTDVAAASPSGILEFAPGKAASGATRDSDSPVHAKDDETASLEVRSDQRGAGGSPAGRHNGESIVSKSLESTAEAPHYAEETVFQSEESV